MGFLRLDPDEFKERVAALTENFKLGELGPIRFVATLTSYGMALHEAQELCNLHLAENRRASSKGDCCG